jgi:hypothetical protein
MAKMELIGFIRLVNETRQTAFWQRFSEVFARNLTNGGDSVLVIPLQPKSGFLPGAGCGRPKILSDEDGANEARQLVSRPLSRPSPTANLVGNWKGDPLDFACAKSSRSPRLKNALSRRAHEKWPRTVATIELVMTANTFAGSYRHTQRGTLILAGTLGLAALFIGLGFTAQKPVWVSVPILVVCAWLFHSLTIEITGCELRWRFGPGLIRKRVPLAEIISAEPVRTGPSWGIHWSPRTGWLYNVSGFDAVAVALRSGKKFALGTDEPLALAARLTEVIQQNQSEASHA